jgi:hypothetical protein
MPHNPKIEAILEAWLDLETCEPPHKNEAYNKLNELLDAAIGNQTFSRAQILDCLFSRFKELKAQRRKESKVSVARKRHAWHHYPLKS